MLCVLFELGRRPSVQLILAWRATWAEAASRPGMPGALSWGVLHRVVRARGYHRTAPVAVCVEMVWVLFGTGEQREYQSVWYACVVCMCVA